ncbi:endonuclease domain-containing protein [Micromonospora zhanjiangensis]|uniref:Endonuclease domain-containing protein n=1 Tax=Micromonospora zhanjiangensis TaxID=1522057 RepID=A0ABV8KIU1_9ACTN
MESSLVDAWPHIPPADRPAPLIRAINDRLTTPDRVAAALAVTPMLVGRTELRALLDRLAAGCLSHLEIWGHDHVFTAPGMPPFLRQFRVQIGGRVLYLDMYAERQRLNIELDGATTHGDPRQREIDLRRDALLATLGILVVRFSHRRLTHEPDEVRRETLAILARRREQPASPRER